MPITINGSGTIDGISAGGLNDGVITFSEISTNAIASSTDIVGIATTGSTIASSNAVTLVGSNASIAIGDVVTGIGISAGTTVSNVSGTSVTLSTNAGITTNSAALTFYKNSKLVTPGNIGGMLCRAWVNFNGTGSSGSAVIRASYNVSSVTYNGTGLFTINFTTAFSDANYAISGFAIGETNTPVVVTNETTAVSPSPPRTVPAVGSCQVQTTRTDTLGEVPCPYVTVAFFR